MKTIGLTFIVFFLAACSARPTSKGTTRFVMGHLALEVGTAGGAFVQAIDKNTLQKTMIKLDSVNSFSVPNSTYDMLFVTFAGPDANTGTMMCGSVPGISVSSEVTITVNVSEANCTQPIFSAAVLELKKGITPKWDTDRWDQSHWGT